MDGHYDSSEHGEDSSGLGRGQWTKVWDYDPGSRIILIIQYEIMIQVVELFW